ncbi:MAG: phosphatase PAP2 family protein [Thermodesulfovibrio sp.]|nr:phosphatase PAP2 family protein [Thermodesulfovibrio sp.]
MDLVYSLKSINLLIFKKNSLVKILDLLANSLIQICLLIFILLIFIFFAKNSEYKWRLKQYVLIGLLTIILSSISAEILSFLIGRARPGMGELFTFIGPNFISGFDSFPSVQATTTFALTVITSYYFPKTKWIIIVIASLIVPLRVLLGANYPLDIMAGIILGILNGRLILGFWENHFLKDFYKLENFNINNGTKLNYYIFFESEKKEKIAIIKKLIKISEKCHSESDSQVNIVMKKSYPEYDFFQNKWSTVIKIPSVESSLYFKIFRYYGFSQLRPIVLYPSKSYKYFSATKHLSKLGINAPKILAFGEIRKGILLNKCFLLYEESFGIPLDKISNLSYDLIKKTARLIHKIHSSGIYHGDLRIQNIIYDQRNNTLGFIDLDKFKISYKYNIPLIIKDMGKLNDPSLNLSWFGRMRFLLIYIKMTNSLWKKRRKILARVIKYSHRVYKFN